MNNSTFIEPLTNTQSLDYSNFINKNTLITSKRGSGKTSFILSIYDELIKLTDFSQVFIVSRGNQYDRKYTSHIPGATIVSDLNSIAINNNTINNKRLC